MNLTNNEMLLAYNRLQNMQDREQEEKKILFPHKAKVTYAIRRNKAKLEAALKPFNEEREVLLKTCSDPENSETGIKEECANDWKDGVNQLLELTEDVDVRMISIDELEDCDLSIADMEAIDFMIE